ncbi:MAG: hypothetical protein WKF92_00410 [Pyrinomonadaceae bacterium]
MATNKIKGKILRIIDKTTLVINLGTNDKVEKGAIFYVLGEPEVIKDLDSDEVLGTVNVTKTSVKATQVFERFSLASSVWTETTYPSDFSRMLFPSVLSGQMMNVGSELNVEESDLEPWRSRTELPVKVGDEVEVTISEEEETEAEPESAQDGAEPDEANAFTENE